MVLDQCGWQDAPAARREGRSPARGTVERRAGAVGPDARASRFIIPNDAGDSAVDTINREQAWEAVRKASGVEDLRVHDLRHAFATRGAGLGASAVSFATLSATRHWP